MQFKRAHVRLVGMDKFGLWLYLGERGEWWKDRILGYGIVSDTTLDFAIPHMLELST